MERFTISLDEFIKYLISKWKILTMCIAAGMIVFVVSMLFWGGKLVIPPSDNYSDLKAQKISFETYIENAPLMKIDATAVHERIVYVSNITERDALKNHVEAGSVWENWSDENFKRYFSDLITWYDVTEQSAEIKIQHYEESECSELSKYLLEQLLLYDNQLVVLQGDGYISSDETIADVQSWYINRLNDVKGQLEYTASGYTIEPSMPAALIAGMMSGICAAVGGLLITFLFEKKKENVCEEKGKNG